MNNSRDLYSGARNGGPLLDVSPDRNLNFQGNQTMANYGQNSQMGASQVQNNMNKSAIVSKQNNLNLPEKLLKMKERVRRDKSANSNKRSQESDARSTSLYGRQKMTNNLENKSDQQMRDSYGQPRSTVRLQKQNFKEDQFDRDNALSKSRGSGSYDPHQYGQAIDKENSLALQNQAESQPNRFKRQQMRSNQNLASYQQKFQKLEQNFKKFTNSIRTPHQSEQMIGDLKYKAGLKVLDVAFQKGDQKSQRRALQIWRLNSGLAQKQYVNQEKSLVLAKAAKKIYMKTRNHAKIQFYQKWKKLTFAADNEGHPAQFKERLISKLSEMVTSTEDFNRCVDNDLYLAQILNKKISQLLQGIGGLVSSDIFFHVNDQLKAYNDATQEQFLYNIDEVIGNSVLGQMIQEGRIITTRDRVSHDHSFNRDIDLPVNQEKIFQMQNEENNSFDEVRGLSIAVIQINEIGILRLYYNCHRDQSLRSPTSFQMRQLNSISQILPLFMQRIFDVRSQINNLAINQIGKNSEIDELSSYNQMSRILKDYHLKVVQDEIVCASTGNLLNFTQMEVENFISDYFQLRNVVLRQIVQRDPNNGSTQNLLGGDGQANRDELVQQTDHLQENTEVIENFLDYKKEYYVHQISVCPIVHSEYLNDANMSMNQTQFHQYSDLTFIFHIKNDYDNKGQNTSAALANMSTSVNTNIAAAVMSHRSDAQKKHLDDTIKHKFCFFLRNLIPILQQSLHVTTNLKPQIQRLEISLHKGNIQQDVANFLQKYVTEQTLIEELDNEKFYFKFSSVIFDTLKAFGLVQDSQDNQDENYQNSSYFALLNQYAFHRINQGHLSQFQFHSFLTEHQLQMFNESIVMAKQRLPFENQETEFQVYDNPSMPTEFKEIGVSSEVMPETIKIKERDHGTLEIMLPLVNKQHHHTMALLVFQANQNSEMSFEQVQTEVASLNDFLTHFLVDLLSKRHSFQLMQEKYDKLMDKLEGEKISQETKDLVDQALIIPFIKKQSLKSIGDGIDALSESLVTNIGENLDQLGQEVSQIAYISNKVFIEDVRLLQTYSQYKSDDTSYREPDQMLMQSYNQKQQIVYEDEILDKVVILYPIMNQASAGANPLPYGTNTRSSLGDDVGLVLRFVISRDNQVQSKLQNIHSQLIQCIQPVIQAILHNGEILIKQQLALKKLSGVIDRYKNINYRKLIYHIRDLKSKNVYNFSRSRLYDTLRKSKRYFELKQHMQSEDSDLRQQDQSQRKLEENQLIQHMIKQALQVMNKKAFLHKQAHFRKFVIGTRKPVYSDMSKKKKRAICSLAELYCTVNMRELFSTFAINTSQYRRLNHPKIKYVSSVKCIFRNYRLIRQRLAFFKLKKNLNLQFNQKMQSYEDADKDLFIQLNQILVSSHQQSGGLEGGFSYAISEIFTYLKNLASQEQFIPNVGNIANEGFVGHIDEAVMTMKSQVYTSHNGANSLQNPNQSKTRILIAQYFDQNNLKRGRDLRLSCESLQNPDVSIIDPDFDNDTMYDEDNELGELSKNFKQCQISSKRDLIHQMLTKSNGVIFNFQNIQQSLQDIFLSQKSKSKDQNIGSRFTIIRRSKSSLIIPLFDVSQIKIIGSLELYRHHQQSFTEDIEARYNYLGKRISDFFQLYGQLKAQAHQISQLKVNLQKNYRPPQSLSLLLKNVYVNAPGNHFSGACHVLPIIILNQMTRVDDRQIESSFFQDSLSDDPVYSSLKLAFFYQFRDNHIYNFEYQGTFIDELMQNGCILEMCQKSSMKKDEGQISEYQSTHRSGAEQSQYSYGGHNDQIECLNSVRHRTIESQAEKVKSVTNELFKHIIYYPIFDIQDEGKIIAILEVAFKKRDPSYSKVIITEDIQDYLNQFRSNLTQFKVRLGSFSRSLENVFQRRHEKKLCKVFQDWKQMMIFQKYKDRFQQNQFQALQNQEMCYSEYMQNLDNYSNQLQTVNQEKQQLNQKANQFMVEKKAKLKFLATSLISSQNQFKKLQLRRVKMAFMKWSYNVSIRKIAENAFTRVLELNHRHSRVRLKAGVFLLKNLMENYSVQGAFNSIIQQGDRNNYHRESRFDFKSRSRSRGLGGESSYVMGNISSLLSPNNMKKIERKNLYEQQINSVYTPVSNSQQQNNSAIINPKILFCTQNTDGSAPMMQHRPDEVVKPRNENKQKRKRNLSKNRSTSQIDATQQSTATVSKYSLGNTNTNTMMRLTSHNPYTDVNVSQIEYTQQKRDYSPIITTSKHELKKLYDPHGHSGRHNRNKQSCTSMTQIKNSRSHSAENYKVGQKRMSAPPTKTDLQKQLYIKQKQLTMMKNQLKKSQKKSEDRAKKEQKKSRQPSRSAHTTQVSMSNQNIAPGQVYNQVRPFHKNSLNKRSTLGPTNESHRTGSINSSDHGSNRGHHNQSTMPNPHDYRGIIDVQDPKVSYVTQNVTNIADQSYEPIQQPVWPSQLRAEQPSMRNISRSRSPLDQANTFDFAPDMRKYQQINGLGVSPPVKQISHRQFTTLEQNDAKLRAARDVKTMLHKRYDDLTSN